MFHQFLAVVSPASLATKEAPLAFGIFTISVRLRKKVISLAEEITEVLRQTNFIAQLHQLFSGWELENLAQSTGLGEPPFLPVIGALANALYKATGKRFYSQPFQPDLGKI